MENIREKQKAEGRKRLEMLHVMEEVLRGYDEGKIFYSERLNEVCDGILYLCSNRPEIVQKMKDIEEEYDIFIYHAHLSHMTEGEMWTFLYVSSNEKTWEDDRECLKDGQAYAYVEWFSEEFGDVGIVPKNGGISRIW